MKNIQPARITELEGRIGALKKAEDDHYVFAIGKTPTLNGRPFHGELKIPRGTRFEIIGVDGRKHARTTV